MKTTEKICQKIWKICFLHWVVQKSQNQNLKKKKFMAAENRKGKKGVMSCHYQFISKAYFEKTNCQYTLHGTRIRKIRYKNKI